MPFISEWKNKHTNWSSKEFLLLGSFYLLKTTTVQKDFFYQQSKLWRAQRLSTKKGSSSLSLSSRNSWRKGDFSEAMASMWRLSLSLRHQRRPSCMRLNLAERMCQMKTEQNRTLNKQAEMQCFITTDRFTGELKITLYTLLPVAITNTPWLRGTLSAVKSISIGLVSRSEDIFT